ncbi:MAG: hypothetical protein U0231_15815 [Nitrospiraceae bacterium]
MGTLMKNMTIGPKFILSIGVSALVVMLVNLFVLLRTGREQDGYDAGGRIQIALQQIMIGRAYIAANYAGKIKKSRPVRTFKF